MKYEPNHYSVTINDSVVIQTTLVNNYREDSMAIEWVMEIRKMYGKKKNKNKKKSQTLAIGLFVEHSLNYKNGNFVYPRSTAKDGPYEIMQICIGNHCLIYLPSEGPFCKALRELLSDNNVIVFGVGMGLAAKKIEKDFGVKLSNPWDLRKLVEFSEDLKPGHCDKYKLEELAELALGKDLKLVKPDRIHWYESPSVNRVLSDEKIKYGTAEAFLVYEMGMKFLEKGTIEAFLK